MKAHNKDMVRQVRSTFGRFLSILVLSFLGVGAFAGLRAVGPDMHLTASTYYEDTQLMDIRAVSTMGFDEADIAALDGQGLIVQPSHMMDMLAHQGEREMAVTLYAAGEEDALNQMILLEGRWPQAADELLVDAFADKAPFVIGSEVRLATGDEEKEIDDVLQGDTFTIVGRVQSSMYVAMDYGSNTVGDGTTRCALFAPYAAFSSEFYTAVFMGADEARQFYGDEGPYDGVIQTKIDALKPIATRRQEERYAKIMDEANEKIADAQTELDDGERERDEKMADALAELQDAEKEIADGEKELADGRRELRDKLSEAQIELEDGALKIEEGRQEIADNEVELEDGRQQLIEAREEIVQNRQKLEDAKVELDANWPAVIAGGKTLAAAREELDAAQAGMEQMQAGIAQLEQLIAVTTDPAQSAALEQQKAGLEQQLAQVDAQYQAGLAQYEAGMQSYNEGAWALAEAQEQWRQGVKDLDEGEETLIEKEDEWWDGKAKLEDGIKELDQAKIDYENGKIELEDARVKGEAKLKDARVELDDARVSLDEGWEEYQQEGDKSARTIADAKVELQEAKDELAELDEPVWYFFTRKDLPSNAAYYENSRRIAAIGAVFPWVFFAVALLVSLTTMTRMADEQRGSIGTMKMLGYGRWSIATKYVLYAALSSSIGSVAGALWGRYFFPWIIANAYGINYRMPPLMMPMTRAAPFVALGLMVGLVSGIAYFAVRSELREVPASLLRPKAPKPGKRIVLERIGFLWRLIPFTWKVTARNIFRFKTRALMTIAGVAGCTALMLVGFGIQDAIGSIAQLQFDDVWQYDLLVAVEAEKLNGGSPALEAKLYDNGAMDVTWWYQEPVKVELPTGDKADVSVVAVQDIQGFTNMVSLHTFKEREPLELGDEGVVLTYKLANMLGAQSGDELEVVDGDNIRHTLTILSICENYASHYAYITQAGYEAVFGEAPQANVALARLQDTSSQAQGEMSTVLNATKGVRSQVYSAATRSTIERTVGELDIIVLVLIGLAGALALVVLYNLTSINIAERVRELATIQVLGFTLREMVAYIVRESMLLTVLGTAVGLLLGIVLEQYIIRTVEIEQLMFAREIKPMSFVYSALLTIGFACAVFAASVPHIRKIDMVQALKSVD